MSVSIPDILVPQHSKYPDALCVSGLSDIAAVLLGRLAPEHRVALLATEPCVLVGSDLRVEADCALPSSTWTDPGRPSEEPRILSYLEGRDWCSCCCTRAQGALNRAVVAHDEEIVRDLVTARTSWSAAYTLLGAPLDARGYPQGVSQMHDHLMALLRLSEASCIPDDLAKIVAGELTSSRVRLRRLVRERPEDAFALFLPGVSRFRTLFGILREAAQRELDDPELVLALLERSDCVENAPLRLAWLLSPVVVSTEHTDAIAVLPQVLRTEGLGLISDPAVRFDTLAQRSAIRLGIEMFSERALALPRGAGASPTEIERLWSEVSRVAAAATA